MPAGDVPGRTRPWFRLRPRDVPLLILAFLWPTYAYFYQGSQHNEAARFDQLRALVEDHTLHIERYAWMNTADGFQYPEGAASAHTYPNKAPGTVFLALAPFAFWRAALEPLPLSEGVYWHLVAHGTTVVVSGLLSSLAAVAFYVTLVRLGLSARASVLGVAAVWLGSILFPYSTLFFSHASAAALLVLAFAVLVQVRRGGLAALPWPAARLGAAGVAMGLAVSSEYVTALPVASLVGYAGWGLLRDPAPRGTRWGGAAALGTGMALGTAVWLGYSMAIFGSPFTTGYAVYARTGAPFPVYTRGFLGIAWPGLALARTALHEILLGPQIGLLYIAVKKGFVYGCNPVFWLALPGWVLLWRRGFRSEAVLILVMTAAYLTFNVCYGRSVVDWGGGASLGPRHLTPLLPFLGIAVAFAAARWWPLFVPLLVVSAFYMLLATAVEPRISYVFRDTYSEFYLPAFLEGSLARNTAALFDEPGAPPNFGAANAFNLGGVLGLPGPWQLLPLLLWWVALGTLIADATRRLPDAAEGAAAPTSEPSFRWAALSPALLSALVVLGLGMAGAAAHRAWLGSTPGLRGRYFGNASWGGPASMVRVDPLIDLDWTRGGPLPPPFTVEWTGILLAPREGDYEFAVECDDGAVLTIDGALVVDNGGTHGAMRKVGTVRLAEGRHAVRLRYSNVLFGGLVRLSWRPPGAAAETIVPRTVLRPE
jgi:hypothetical protein